MVLVNGLVFCCYGVKMNAKCLLSIVLLSYLPLPVMAALNISQVPLNLTVSGTPLIMLTMERDHKLYYEAYNDASDITGDGKLDIHYNPAIKYYGYFDSYKCYTYSSGVFSPSNTTTDKTCTSKWSGDFLNYLTMSRMDALRRVLYGGKRSSDTTTETVLERSYIPQDAHSWGKEYTSTTVDGYDISLFAPLSQPMLGTRHLFANTSLLCPDNTDPSCPSLKGLPILRVLNDSTFRVWEWLSIERPVAGVQCATGNNSRSNCVVAASSSSWNIMPSTFFSGLTQTTYKTKNYKGSGIDNGGNGFADSETEFDGLVSTYGIEGKKCGSGSASNINGSGNSFHSGTDCGDNEYLTIFEGNLVIPAGQGGSYKLAVDGDDAVDVRIDGFVVAYWYGGHGSNNGDSSLDSHSATVTLSAGTHTIKFRHQENDGGDSYYLYWQKSIPASTMTDYVVKVKACVAGLLENEECRGYPANNPTVYKPSGILQQYGENDRMAFGLFTGSYDKNESGGVLRKNVSSFTDEIAATTGILSSTNGIIKTLDALKIVGFGNSYSYDQNCGVPEVNAPLAENRCRMWGNPTAEMMYEGLRYFAGKTTPTTGFSYTGSTDDSTLGLPLPAWKDPYVATASGGGGYPSCSKPSQMVISDINPNFDTNQLPGRFEYTAPSALTPSTFSGDISGLNVKNLSDSIWVSEYGAGASKTLFIGQSSNTYDGAPTDKTVTSFGTMRGLSPEEPTQQGGYYAASVALYGKTNDLNTVTGNQKTDTFSVALASPLPRISFPINNKTITLVPFGKTVGGCGSVTTTKGNYQPTNTIVDFYVDTVANTNTSNTDTATNSGRPYAKFRINYEDSEYGSDHDMDAIAEYELTALANNTVDVKISSNYAAGGCIQHMGYVIDGTSADGIYLEIRDPDTTSDVDYYLDTPNTSGQPLPTITTRNFSTGTNSEAAFVDHDPLWYAAKWGGFVDINNNNALDETSGIKEWDNRDGADGVPDSYFLVTNATKLKQQLDRTFTEILSRESSSSSVATNSSSLRTGSRVFQAKFKSSDWSGQLLSYQISSEGVLTLPFEWDGGSKINSQNYSSGRVIITKGVTGDGVAFAYANLTGDSVTADTQKYYLDKNANNVTDSCGLERIAYLRGSASHEAAGGTFTCASGSTIDNFRQRPTSKLGDVVNSNPWYLGAPSSGLSDVDFPGYNTFRRSKLSRKPVVYVGGNDGMLHGFDASLDFSTTPSGALTSTSGNEVLAFLPSQVFPNLSKLTAQNYNQNHLYFVDSSPMVADADLGSSTNDWRSVLVGAMGGGGKGYYALDVTDPANFTEAKAADIFLWEFNETDMGYAYNTSPADPSTLQAKQIVKMGNDKWAVILGNGYNSANGKAVLYILFIKDGMDGTWSTTDYVKIVAESTAGSDNGLSTPVPFDSNDDGIVDIIYAGDLKGNMWKFLVDKNSTDKNDTSNWKVAFSTATCGNTTPSTCTPLFKAMDASSTPKSQPIFWPPEVTLHPVSGQLVLFGTGKFFENSDATSTNTQTFYGIWDKNDGTTTVGARAANLLQQTLSTSTSCPSPITAEDSCTKTTTAGTFRIPTARAITWRTSTSDPAADCSPATTCNPTHLGWYIDYPISGERTTGIPTLVSNLIFFNTLIPGTTICDAGTGWLMALDYASGGLYASAVFDTDKSGKIDGSDSSAAGFQIGASIGGTRIITPSDPTVNQGVGVSSLSDGENRGGVGTTILAIPGGLRGRLNWQEIIPDK